VTGTVLLDPNRIATEMQRIATLYGLPQAPRARAALQRAIQGFFAEIQGSFAGHIVYTIHVIWHLGCIHMGWLRLVGSLKLQVSFAKETYQRDGIL